MATKRKGKDGRVSFFEESMKMIMKRRPNEKLRKSFVTSSLLSFRL